MKKLFTRETRKYVYSVALAFAALAVYLGWMDPAALPVVLPLVLALLNLTPKEVEATS
ncbi:hypothetical protein ACFSYH_05850 [Populibacterium corticicola]|uniref:AI-2E family transporter n=1 Tax=Populibacterium corticicola TaxID=1812826 RepID=A0ABW5XCP4_9MICO